MRAGGAKALVALGGKVTSQREARVTPRSQSTAGHHSSSNARGDTSTPAGERVLPGVVIDLPEGSEVADGHFPPAAIDSSQLRSGNS